MTLAQWKNTRRVDHLNIFGHHPRVRGQSLGLTDLKVFDADVAAVAQANNNFDRVTMLGVVIQSTRLYLSLPAGTVLPRYVAAVNKLFASATIDLNLICGGAYQAPRTADLDALEVNHALGPKNVTLNIFYLAPVGAAPAVGPVDVLINAHILNANNAHGHNRAGITFARANPVATVATQTAAGDSILNPVIQEVPLQHQGKLAEGGNGGRRLITYCNASAGAANSIDVVYVDNYEDPLVLGKTYRANATTYGVVPVRPITTVTRNPPPAGAATSPTTLAHELGHALTSESGHSTDVNNLMAGGLIRNANNILGDGQVAWFRNNPYT